MATKGCAPEDNYLCVNNYTAAVHAWTAQSAVLSSLDVGAVRISIPRWESFLIDKLMVSTPTKFATIMDFSILKCPACLQTSESIQGNKNSGITSSVSVL